MQSWKAETYIVNYKLNSKGITIASQDAELLS
jgi:hypothetical protein